MGMADRRSFLKGLLGAGVLGPQIAVAEAAAALGVSTAATVGAKSIYDLADGGASVGAGPAGPPFGWRLVRPLHNHRENERTPVEHLPVHIRTKKSWSDAYKVGEAARERAIFDAYIERIEKDEAFALKFATAMGWTGLLR